ncbi:MAG: Gamma-butyrobetaine hydroxylase-like, N-terminal, partial [Blastocatellia bacterium]|nr:Gamma-butyrobetaine hydroxylase-like, N-terminal [Blastocatellia bacterium]
EISDLNIVGRYALNFRWSDGHETGIYSFQYLRDLCEQ